MGYQKEIDLLTGWAGNRIKDPVILTEEDYLNEKLPQGLDSLLQEATNSWWRHRGYQLSQKQLFTAFVAAAKANELLALVPRHPDFRLGTLVVLDKIKVNGESPDEYVFGVPAQVSWVKGDEHKIAALIKVGDDEHAGDTYVMLQTEQLDQRLKLVPLVVKYEGTHEIKWVRYNPETHVLAVHHAGFGTTEYKGLSDLFATKMLSAEGPEALRIMVRDHLEDFYWRTSSRCKLKDGSCPCCTDPDSVPEGNGKWNIPDE